jgi:Na+/phosphate symporter
LLNLVIGYILFRAGKISNANKWTIVIFFAGILFISLMLSSAFVDKVHQ